MYQMCSVIPVVLYLLLMAFMEILNIKTQTKPNTKPTLPPYLNHSTEPLNRKIKFIYAQDVEEDFNSLKSKKSWKAFSILKKMWNEIFIQAICITTQLDF